MDKILNDLLKMFDQTKEVFPLILFGMIAGIAKVVVDGKKMTLALFITSAFLGGFISALTGFLLQPINIHIALKFFISGVAAHSGGAILVVYQKKVLSYLSKIKL